MIAALFVCPGGVYWDLEGVDPWDERRDARLYAGPWPVVAHPPCERWGRYWHGGPNSVRFQRERRCKGDDGGCFAAALASVRRCGGVLEHPEASTAWRWFDLNEPPYDGGCIAADFIGGWTCRVEQGHYGHRARKGTWLYACRVSALPSFKWGPSEAAVRLDDGFHSAEERRRLKGERRNVERLSKRERLTTPLPFRDVLLAIARTPQRRAA